MRTAQRFRAPKDGHPDMDMLAAWKRDGYLLLEGFKSEEERDALRSATDAIVEAFDPSEVRTIFSTSEQEHAADVYFRESGDKVRCFFEADAFDDDGNLVVPKGRALNKIGHAMHDLDPVFDRFCRDERLSRLAGALGMAEPGLIQSMVIFKQPHIGGEVGMHQDASFLHTEPVSALGFWFALDDADQANGCLVALPGAHKGPLKERFHYAGNALVMEKLAEPDWDENALVALEAPAGSLVVLHGLLPHGSAPNTSERSRLAFALHAYDRTTAWSEDNWLRRSADMPVRGF